MPSQDLQPVQNPDFKYQQVTLTITHDCNLRCRYCYEPNKSRNQYMTHEVAQKAIVEFMEADNEYNGVEFAFFGGEPMLVFNLIRDLVDWFHTIPWRKNHAFSIGTNGTILTKEMRPWLVDNKSCVWMNLSLDGNKTAHDINRSNSYDVVRKNLPFFIENWPNQSIKMTISAESIPYVADSIIELEEMGVPFSANVVFEDIWGDEENKAKLLDVYAEQLDRLVQYYVKHPNLFPARIIDRRP